MNRFSSVTKSLPTASSFFSRRNILIFLFILFLIAILTASYYYLKQKSVKYNDNGTKQSNSGSGSSGGGAFKEAEIMIFTTDWCPHCKSAKPEWEKVKSEYSGKDIDGYNLIFTEVNCTNESPQVEKLMNQYKIEGYPTVKMVKDGQVIEFDAKPTYSNLSQFITTVL